MSKDNIQKKKGIPAGILIFIGLVFLPIILLLVFVTLKLIIEGKQVVIFIIFLMIELSMGYLISFNPIRKGIKKLSKKSENIESKDKIKKSYVSDEAKQQQYKNYKEFKEKEMRDFLENLPQNNKNIICRNTRYDGDIHAILFLLKVFVIGWVPIILGIYLSYLLSKSVDFKIQPGTWQAYVSLILVIASAAGMVIGIMLYSKRNNVGSKYFYYVIAEEGLYFTHVGEDAIGGFIRAHMKIAGKIKSVPLWVYVLIFMLIKKGRAAAIRLAYMETSFKVSRKYQIAEKLLNCDMFENFCNKVVGVTQIKEYLYGSKTTWKYLRAGVECEETQIIYKTTDNYEHLISEFRKRLVCETVGDTLSRAERYQVYANITRRTLTLLFAALVLILISIDAYGMYLRNTAAAESLHDGIFKSIRYIFARRAERRSIRGIYGVILLVVIPIIKMIVDIVRARTFTVVSVKAIDFYKSKQRFYYEIFSEFHYFAKVEWQGETVTVGLSKDMWKQRESVEPLLVLRKGIPYCLIYRKNLSER